MSNTFWPSVTAESPCYVCGKPDWCSTSSDGKKAICRRRNNGTGERKVDTSGQEYWLYDLNGHRELNSSEDVSQQDGEVPEKANPQTLDRVYGALLDQLALSPAHRQDLHRRGLTEASIKRGGYRTLTPKGREELARNLVEHFGVEVCSQVHVPMHDDLDLSVVRLTEGELKADVATALTGTLTVSMPGSRRGGGR